MPSRAVPLVFLVGGSMAFVIVWLSVDPTPRQAIAFLTSMIAGGNYYWMLRARE